MGGLASGPFLSATTFIRHYGNHVYKHGQYPPPKSAAFVETIRNWGDALSSDPRWSKSPKSENEDHHQSPMSPEAYILARIVVALEFYRRRIPEYTRHAALFKLVIPLLAVGASVCALMEQDEMVILLVAGVVGLTTWTQLTNAQRKVERYSHAAVSLKKVLVWWNSLGDVEKAANASIDRLVLEAERIILEAHDGRGATALQYVVPDVHKDAKSTRKSFLTDN